MRRFTDAGRRAISGDNLYAALILALIIPDICGSIADPGPGKTRSRYIRWFRRWAEPKFTSRAPSSAHPHHVFISAEDCYQIRCSLIHSGSSEIEPNQRNILATFMFCDRSVGSHMNWFEGNTINGVRQPNFLQVKVDLFSAEMFSAADEWDEAVAQDPDIQAEKEKLLVIHTRGAIIGGVRFG